MYTITMSRKGIPNKVSKKVLFECLTCSDSWLDYPSRIGRKKFCSQSCSAKSRIEELRQRSLGNNWGSLRNITDELRKKLSDAQKGKRSPARALSKTGKKNPNWRGGTSPENKRIRMSAEFKMADKDKVRKLCTELGEVGKYYDGYTKRSFAFAFHKLWNLTNYDQKRMLHKLLTNKKQIPDYSVPSQYLGELLRLYNHGLEYNQQLVFPL